MRPSRKLAFVVSMVVWSLLLVFAHPALAEMGDVSIGGVWVCRLARGTDGFALGRRMEQIERNIYAVLNNPRYRDQRQVPVRVKPMGQNAAITVDGAVILLVTPEDVEGTGAKPIEAAQQWAQRLARGLSQALPDPRFQVF